jgi:asparagine synthetase B (glutamine-hydrolysing)
MITTSRCVVEPVALRNPAALLAGGIDSSGLAVLVGRIADPVDSGVTADGLVERVDHDHLEDFVGGVLIDPVRIYFESSALLGIIRHIHGKLT